jgi:hypothetical protein
MVAANRIIRFLGMRAVNCKLSAATTNFKAGRYCRYRRRKALSAAKSAYANNMAVIYAGLGEKDEAFSWLQRAYDERSYILAVYLNTDSRLDSLRSDPRFDELRRRIGLPAPHLERHQRFRRRSKGGRA